VVVDKIGIVEIHAPPLALWRKTAEEEHFGILGQKRPQRVILHIFGATGNVSYV
jgi:hypothetical protein